MKNPNRFSTIKTLLLLSLLCLSTKALAHDFEVDGVFYNINSNGDKVTVTYKGGSYSAFSDEYSGCVTIPSFVTYNGTSYSVVSIGAKAFMGCSKLSNVRIPESVLSIGGDAFYGCSGLESMTIPHSVISIGSYVFHGCLSLDTLYYNAVNCSDFCQGTTNPFYYSNISTIIIGDGVQKIPDFFTYGLNQLTNIVFGNSVSSIGRYAFINCSGLNNVTIPNTVKSIGEKAFYGCSNLNNINIPNSLVDVGEEAFFGTAWYSNQPDGLVYAGLVAYKYKGVMADGTNVIIREGTLSVASGAFINCNGLTSITLPCSLTIICRYAFQGCSGLKTLNFNAISCDDFSSYQHPFSGSGITTINIGECVQKIPAFFAYGLAELRSITIPNSVEVISRSAFVGCSGLTNVTIPNSVTTIGDYVFSGCDGLTNITVANENTTYDSRNNCNAIVETSSNTLVAGCKMSFIPSSVISIEEGAFNGCRGLTEITIPESIISIGRRAFSGCTALNILNFNAVSCADFSPNEHQFENANISTINIGNCVQRIPAYFANETARLSSITIPNTVTEIGTSAFNGHEELKDVYSEIITPSLVSMGENVFKLEYINNYSDRLLHVPVGSVAAYMADAHWRPFFGAIVDSDSVSEVAESFEVNGIQYTVTSDTSVMVTGQTVLDIPEYYDEEDHLFRDYVINIEIPGYVTYNNKNYTVTSIGDWVFYNENSSLGEECNISYYIDIMIPETVISIGYEAFGGSAIDMINVICLAKTPPIMNNSFICCGDINLFVPAEAYALYQELNNQNHYCSSIYVTNGERSETPLYNEITLEQPVSYPYGWVVKIYPPENSVVYVREDFNDTGLYNHVYIGEWKKFENSDSLYYYFASQDYWGAKPDGWMVEFMVIEEGKSPSYVCKCGSLNIECLDNKWWESFDFIDTDICYNIIGDSVGVTFQGYTNPWDYKKRIVVNKTNKKASYPEGKSVDFYYLDADEIIYYFGDVVIPRTATYHKYDNYTDYPNHCYYETYTTYPVTSIDWFAFKDCVNLKSVVLPRTISSIGEEAFSCCPNLTFIKCLSLAPPTAYVESFDEGVCQNTTLYVPMSAVEAYRNAPGWCEFQNIVGFYDYDFEQDGLYFKKTGDGEVVVTCGENAYSGSVTVPTTVTNQGVTYSVTGIGDGAFAGAEIDALYLPVTITTIGEGAFADSHIQSLYITGSGAWSAGGLGISVENLYVGSGVNGMARMQVSASVIYSYSTIPPACDNQTFLDYNAELHVPSASVAAYFTAAYWCNFLNIVGDAVQLTSITLDDESIELLVGSQATLTATLNPANAVPADITWMSSDETIATVNDGMVTGVAAGECDIVAICQNKRATCHVTVTEILPTSITLNHETAKLEVGSQLALTATLQPDDVTMTTVSWATTDSTVAMVAGGVVTAVGAGECTITATCGELQAQCHIIVVEHLIYITLDEHEATVVPNHIITLTPTVTPVSTDLVVTSSNPSVAAARMANGKVQVVGISEGETVIRLQSADGYAEPDSCYVIVYTEVGDVNRDGFVNLADVVGIINYLLQGNDGQYSFENADVNHDNGVNVGDLSLLISYLLGGVDLEPNDPVNPSRSFTVNGVTFKMMRVTGGTFQMGATAEMDSDAGADESPVHDVTLSTYYMGQTEVTQELWQAVMGTNPSYYTGDLQRPVDKVSYSDCEAFIAQLNELTGQNFRLPTEAEWEFAARGGNRSHHYLYSGSNDATEVAWCTTTSDGTTHPVATKRPNELGIYDMSGNVCEWCGEWYSLYPEEPQVNPTGPETGRSRVHRGGSLQFLEKNCTVTRRNYFSPGIVRSYMGLRLVL